MTLAEFNCIWVGNYNKEQRDSYAIMYGDNESAWPETNDVEPVVIDLERVCRFNPHHKQGITTVEIAGGLSFSLLVHYGVFKKIMCAFSNIQDFTTTK